MSEQFQVVFWVLSVLYMGIGLFLSYRVLRALGYIPMDEAFAWSSAFLVVAGGSVLYNAFQSITFSVLQLITLLTTQGGKEATIPSVWGNVPGWIYLLFDIGIYLLTFAFVVRFGWGRLPELLTWSSAEEEDEEDAILPVEDTDAPENEGEEPFSETEGNDDDDALSFLEQGSLLLGVSYLAYSLLTNIQRLLLFVPFLRQPQRTPTNVVGFGSAWVAGLVLFAMVAYLVYNKVAET